MTTTSPTYGVTAQTVIARFHGLHASAALLTAVEGWIAQRADVVATYLHQQGIDPTTVAAAERLYGLAAQALEKGASADVARSITHQHPQVVDGYLREMDRLLALLASHVESLRDEAQGGGMSARRGVFRWGDSGPAPTPAQAAAARAAGGFWRRGRGL